MEVEVEMGMMKEKEYPCLYNEGVIVYEAGIGGFGRCAGVDLARLSG